ncbi:galactokinase [Bacillus sp. 03113]|uniref:galactokinase n=1 Tax=Bacillus sp. 03113 TaxID=2578211 RepID=UPI0011426C32|nr:galactokinase [Bacillus sp. 03113]
MKQVLVEKFIDLYNTDQNLRVFFAPGRINLIGEHTDYNGGHVFPCSLSIGTYAVARKREDQKIKLFSENFQQQGMIEFNLNDLVFEEGHDWANFPKGIVKALIDHGYVIDQGFDVLFYGNIPNGAGLSSSASIELATAVMLKGLFQLDVEMIDLVKLSQLTENEFIGVNCGIMDQFSIGMGKKDRAILLKCDTLEYTYSPIQLLNASLVISNTNKKRELASSKYNERRSECEEALKQLQNSLAVESLCDVTINQFLEQKHLIQNEVNQKRAQHVIYENERTIRAVEKLKEGDLKGFGQLMNESHQSLRDYYEVTGIELDTLVEAAWAEEGVIGSRMTGAGFGGCTVSIVENDKIDQFIRNVGQKYQDQTGLTADFYVVEIGDGAKEITEKILSGRK